MKKLFIILGIGIILIACDRSIENQLGNSIKNNGPIEVEKVSKIIEENVVRKTESKEGKEQIASDKAQEISEKKAASDSKNVATNEDVMVTKKENEQAISTLTKTEKPQIKKVTTKSPNITLQKKTEPGISEPPITKVKEKAENNIPKSKTVSERRADNQKNIARKKAVKNTRTTKKPDNDGVYENGKKISNFTEEELRVGSQKMLSKDEIQYFKSLCRYALMSEQDIIEHRCEAKKVTIAR